MNDTLTETLLGYGDTLARLAVGISPILFIGYILLTAREDEEEEKCKLENSKKLKKAGCCKSC